MRKPTRKALSKSLADGLVFKLFKYNRVTGEFTWRARTPDMFDGDADSQWSQNTPAGKCDRWNARYAGKRAGYKHPSGYMHVKIFGILYGLHNIAWLMINRKWPNPEADHKNRIKSDNRWCNLRKANRFQNCQNRGVRSDNSLGATGIVRTHNKFLVRIQANGKRIKVGRFATLEQAKAAYKKYSKKMHGKFSTALRAEHRGS